MTVKQISVFVQNSPGRLTTITGLLAASGIDIRAISISDTVDFGILRLIVNDPDKCQQVLEESGLTVSITEVLAVGLNDTPGALAKTMKTLSDNGINVEYVYAFVSHSSQQACIIMRVVDLDKAAKVLEAAGVQMLSPEVIYNF